MGGIAPHKKNDEDYIVICNVNIHKEANLSRSEFLEKVKHVEEIRCREEDNFASFYITSVEEFKGLKLLYDLVNHGNFIKHNDYYHVFAVAINPILYEWFQSTSFHVIEKQIVFWMASIYFFSPDKREEIFNKQFYPPIIDECKNIINSVYSQIAPLNNKIDTEILSTHDLDKTKFNFYPRDLYFQASRKYLGLEPPEFLSNPFGSSNNNEFWGIRKFNFTFIEAVFTERDWDNIIVKEEYDILKRAESRPGLWYKWKHTFATFEISKRKVYSFYLFGDEEIQRPLINHNKSEGDNSGFVYLMRNPLFESDIYKIGLTRKKPEQRAKGLSNTSVPDKFYTICYWYVEDCIIAEKRIKTALSNFIIDPKREFIRIHHRDAIEIIETELTKLNGGNNSPNNV